MSDHYAATVISDVDRPLSEDDADALVDAINTNGGSGAAVTFGGDTAESTFTVEAPDRAAAEAAAAAVWALAGMPSPSAVQAVTYDELDAMLA